MLLIPCDIPALGCGCFFQAYPVGGRGQAPDKPDLGQISFERLILNGQRGMLDERHDAFTPPAPESGGYLRHGN